MKIGDLCGIWGVVFKGMMLLQPAVIAWATFVTVQIHEQRTEIRLIRQQIEQMTNAFAAHQHYAADLEIDRLKSKVALIESSLRRNAAPAPP